MGIIIQTIQEVYGSFIGDSTADNNITVFKKVEIAVSLKYLSNF